MTPPDAARRVFDGRLSRAEEYVRLMAERGVEHGVIGPREVDRLWERHVLNSAVLSELVPRGCSLVDVGSGAGLPGVPLAIARPDLDIVLLEPMARRVAWLTEVLDRLDVRATVVRGRAEEQAVLDKIGGADVVTARALAPLARLCRWCLPLARPNGSVLAMKGASAAAEVDRDRQAMRAAGAAEVDISYCGTEVLATPVTVVSVSRGEVTRAPRTRRSSRNSRRRSGK